ncbi:ATP-binding cassette domain-containing protein [Trinickia caryophylli]|uniref:Branched-chain amino acid transport system ATP-binding protein n=1 Tax=Trinickia caryophylli TaxID=28094 RepID=A0A1X7DXI4_TRICW|nr:ATP-binding cassette domain-containing protein [Trinickia caryophylli]PMS14223.1 ABC transporter ATP-binding protein [Trinickia caryophylli]TRX17922.1 ATP-binding cassette domain-containing protein [Trinickia caryophylli]WQE11303.1 ATP-binding cassette domain-containing protein [Trinickia caryophylli]SMF23027.1 branched-chain amino acid transport system ATP-binding protein [Trinickia caryophylli]GLU32454.1 ABC transporter ATP-binding protein [Trinickia caryophylli]
MSCPPLLQILALAAARGATAVLDDVSLSVAPGSTACVLGEPGAGKSTLLMTVAGLVRPSRGSIRFAGEEIRRKRANEIAARGIAWVPQNRLLFRNLSVRENLLAYVWREPDRARVEADAARLFERFPRLGARAQESACQLSSSDQQLLAIGRALMSRPTMLLIDDPTADLPPGTADDICAWLAELNRDGIGVLLGAREPHTPLLRLASDAYRLAQGRIVSGGERRTSDSPLRGGRPAPSPRPT